MVPLFSLWMPIVVSAVLVFVASSIMHMALKYHHDDFRNLPDEDGVRAALKPFAIPPGEYMVPGLPPKTAWNAPERKAKLIEGPIAIMTFMKPGLPEMGPQLAMWFGYCVLVGVFAAYVAGGLIAPGAPYLHVHRYVGAVAFCGYGLALMQHSIWYKRAWSVTLKSLFDALVYGLVTGGVFGWLWPHA
ncbi:MAG TPA: hypothetical protein PLQ13_01015 [Candidatus Krumholzibacteria bacterium]|nr:hypothetical protein [Candidatus Krumholzibacteria bacterium]